MSSVHDQVRSCLLATKVCFLWSHIPPSARAPAPHSDSTVGASMRSQTLRDASLVGLVGASPSSSRGAGEAASCYVTDSHSAVAKTSAATPGTPLTAAATSAQSTRTTVHSPMLRTYDA